MPPARFDHSHRSRSPASALINVLAADLLLGDRTDTTGIARY
jgi:hypothetical protein